MEANNVEEMREALRAALDLIFDMQNADRSPLSHQAYAVRRKIKAALARPLRECDVGTAEQQLERFKHQCFEHHTGRCSPHCRTLPAKTRQECALKWAQMPYTSKEGSAECT